MKPSDPRGIYWGDYAMWQLTPWQRRALQVGQITPMETRQMRDIRAASLPPLKEQMAEFLRARGV